MIGSIDTFVMRNKVFVGYVFYLNSVWCILNVTSADFDVSLFHINGLHWVSWDWEQQGSWTRHFIHIVGRDLAIIAYYITWRDYNIAYDRVRNPLIAERNIRRFKPVLPSIGVSLPVHDELLRRHARGGTHGTDLGKARCPGTCLWTSG